MVSSVGQPLGCPLEIGHFATRGTGHRFQWPVKPAKPALGQPLGCPHKNGQQSLGRHARTASPICFLALLPALFWTGGSATAPQLKRAGIEQVSVPPGDAPSWEKTGFSVTPLSEDALRKRKKLTTPGINRNVMVASATTAPWVDGNGWRILREPAGQFWYDLPAGPAPLAAAEAFVYGGRAVLKIDPADLDSLAQMLRFLRSLPEQNLPDVADFGFVDDGSDPAGEDLNLLTRRNLLYRVIRAPDPRLRLNVKPTGDDPHLFAAKVRERLTDDQRTLRIYGSEVVLFRMAGDNAHARIHLLNYGHRPVEEVRLRVRGSYSQGKVYTPDSVQPIKDSATAEGFTEFSVANVGVYAVVDLAR